MNRSVFKKIAELEHAKTTALSEVKIDLALVDEMARITKEGSMVAKELEESVSKTDKTQVQIQELQKFLQVQIREVQTISNAAKKWQDKEDQLYDKIAKASADLGVKKEDLQGWKEYIAQSDYVQQAIIYADKYNK